MSPQIAVGGSGLLRGFTNDQGYFCACFQRKDNYKLHYLESQCEIVSDMLSKSLQIVEVVIFCIKSKIGSFPKSLLVVCIIKGPFH